MKTMLKKETTAIDYLGYALYAFGGLGIEILLLMLEASIWGTSQSEWIDLQDIIHWVITCLIWGLFAFLLLKHVPKEEIKVRKCAILPVLLIMMGSIIFTSVVWNGCKPVIELINHGGIKFIIQYIYYAFESMLMVLIIIFGQLSYEKFIGKKSKLPAGSILLAMTWGLVHIVTQGVSTGIYACIQACLFGMVYLVLQRNTKISYMVISFMFMV